MSNSPTSATAGLTVKMRLRLSPDLVGEATLATVCDADGRELVRVLRRRAGEDQALREWDVVKQNYLGANDPAGAVAVVEVVSAIEITPPFRAHLPRSVRLGMPLSRVRDGEHELVLRLRPGKADLFIDGVLVDEDWPCGGAAGTAVQQSPHLTVWARALSDAELGLHPDYGGECETLDGHQLQYWSPSGHNRWAGDTMIFHDGERLHLLYLIDRRHHASKGHCGGHQIAHLTTTDLCRWQSHPLAIAIDEPWEAVGTGSMVRHEGRWALIYGLHSARSVTDAITGEHLPQDFAAHKGTPLGTTIATSDDGIHFHKERVIVHAAQNPSVFADPAGGFCMFAGEGAYGLYRSDDLLHWRAVDHFIVPYGETSPWRNTCECMCHVAWNGWHYLMGGFTGFWMARDLAGPYWDQAELPAAVSAISAQIGAGAVNPRHAGMVVRPRWDIYDGLSVPMVATMPDGRRILAGWLHDTHGWAGCLVVRELLQESDGTLGMRWPLEMVPATTTPIALTWAGAEPDGAVVLNATTGRTRACATGLPDSCLIEMTIAAGIGNGTFSIIIIGDDNDAAGGCELRLDGRRRVAQWGTPTAHSLAPDLADQPTTLANMGVAGAPYDRPSRHIAYKAGDFAIGGVEGLDRRFTLRLLVINDLKSRSTVIDAEIDGRRTLITRRQGMTGRRLMLCAQRTTVRVTAVVVSPVAER